MEIEELSKMLIRHEDDIFISLDGAKFRNYEEALKYTNDWLNRESKDKYLNENSISVGKILKAAYEIEDLVYHPSLKNDLSVESMGVILNILKETICRLHKHGYATKNGVRVSRCDYYEDFRMGENNEFKH